MPSGEVVYEIVKAGSNDRVYESREDIAQIPGASPSQVTIKKFFDLRDLAPGAYILRLKITDTTTGQALTSSAQFTVT